MGVMISPDDLVALVRAYNPRTDGDLIRDAYLYAKEMHEGQERRSGDPYIIHPVEVAGLLTEQRLDVSTPVLPAE